MSSRTHLERRKIIARAPRLGRPLFIDVPKAAATSTLTACALAVNLTSFATPSPPEIGSILLLICAFAAWFVGNRFAVLLGCFIVSIQFLNGQLIDTQAMHLDDLVDTAFGLTSALIVVLMLGVARVALEIEWKNARYDPLTGALSRKAFFEAIQSDECDKSLSVLIFADLDGLKPLNDRLGHEYGDQAICNFVASVRKSIRKHDIIARIGGDEFVIYLKVTDREAAQVVAERLHQIINLQATDETVIGCSFGVLLLPTGSRSIDRELGHADTLMYDAKRSRSGFSIAMMVENNQETPIQIASGIRPEDLQAAGTRSSQRPSQRPQAAAEQKVA